MVVFAHTHFQAIQIPKRLFCVLRGNLPLVNPFNGPGNFVELAKNRGIVSILCEILRVELRWTQAKPQYCSKVSLNGPLKLITQKLYNATNSPITLLWNNFRAEADHEHSLVRGEVVYFHYIDYSEWKWLAVSFKCPLNTLENFAFEVALIKKVH